MFNPWKNKDVYYSVDNWKTVTESKDIPDNKLMFSPSACDPVMIWYQMPLKPSHRAAYVLVELDMCQVPGIVIGPAEDLFNLCERACYGVKHMVDKQHCRTDGMKFYARIHGVAYIHNGMWIPCGEIKCDKMRIHSTGKKTNNCVKIGDFTSYVENTAPTKFLELWQVLAEIAGISGENCYCYVNGDLVREGIL